MSNSFTRLSFLLILLVLCVSSSAKPYINNGYNYVQLDYTIEPGKDSVDMLSGIAAKIKNETIYINWRVTNLKQIAYFDIQRLDPKSKEYVSIWSIVMSKTSAARFRVLFFALIFTMILFGVFLVWMLWKFYPILRTRGLKNLLNPEPFRNSEEPKEGP